MFKKFLASSLILFLGIGLFNTAEAHVTLNPEAGEPGAYDKYDVRVPVERDENTTKVELEVPEEMNLISVMPVDGFDYSFEKDSEGNITQVTWEATDKGIGPNEFIEFPIIVANSDDTGTFPWNALQTYEDGEVVKWTGESDSETPAPITEVKEDANEIAGSTETNSSSTALFVISILAIILSLVAIFKKK